MPKRRPWEQFERWLSQCGPIYSLFVFSRKIIALIPSKAPRGDVQGTVFAAFSSNGAF
ncbi:hypothetical protein V5O48_019250, partial [Marasmius crinis-equi]